MSDADAGDLLRRLNRAERLLAWLLLDAANNCDFAPTGRADLDAAFGELIAELQHRRRIARRPARRSIAQ